MNAPNSAFPFGRELDTLWNPYLLQINGSWLKVQKISERVNGKLVKNIDAGWLHADKTVLTRYPILNEVRSTRKAMALISLEDGSIGLEQLEKLKDEYVLYSDPNGRSKKGISDKFQIYYILKELNGMKLLSPY